MNQDVDGNQNSKVNSGKMESCTRTREENWKVVVGENEI